MKGSLIGALASAAERLRHEAFSIGFGLEFGHLRLGEVVGDRAGAWLVPSRSRRRRWPEGRRRREVQAPAFARVMRPTTRRRVQRRQTDVSCSSSLALARATLATPLARGFLLSLRHAELGHVECCQRIHVVNPPSVPRPGGRARSFDGGIVVHGRGSDIGRSGRASAARDLICRKRPRRMPYRLVAGRAPPVRRASRARRQVGDQVVGRLDPDRQADERLVDLERRAGDRQVGHRPPASR